MLPGRAYSNGLWPILLSVFLLFYGQIARADPILETDTTAPAAAPLSNPNLQDTVNFVIFDYSTATFTNAQALPIDRPFNIKVVNIPADTTVDSLYILQIEPRNRRTKYKFHNGDLVLPAELDSMIIVRWIKCNGSTLKTKAGEKIFIEPRNLTPNRTYVVSFGGHSDTKISATQRAAIRGTLKPLLRGDPYFNKIIRKDFNDRYLHPAHSLMPLKLSQDSLHAHLQKVVQQRYPQYMVLFPDSKADTVHYYFGFANAVRELRSKMNGLDTCDKSPTAQSKIKNVENRLGRDTIGSIDTVLSDVQDSLHVLQVADSCGNLLTLTLRAVDSIEANLDSAIYTATDSVLVENMFNAGVVSATYYVDIVKNAQRNVTLDIGGGYSWGMDQFFGYYAINIYLRSIDKNLPLWSTNYGFWDYLGSHMSLVVGLTLTSVSQPRVRTGIVGNDGLILGAGFRLLPWLKVSSGTLVYNRLSTDPLVSVGARTHFGLFASLSFDLDVKGIFSSIPLINQLVLK